MVLDKEFENDAAFLKKIEVHVIKNFMSRIFHENKLFNWNIQFIITIY